MVLLFDSGMQPLACNFVDKVYRVEGLKGFTVWIIEKSECRHILRQNLFCTSRHWDNVVALLPPLRALKNKKKTTKHSHEHNVDKTGGPDSGKPCQWGCRFSGLAHFKMLDNRIVETIGAFR